MQETTEEWRVIAGFPDYEISSLGNMRRTTKLGKVFKLGGTIDKLGYQQVGLVRNGKQVWFLVHRLVAAAFLPLPVNHGGFLTVNHKNRNKADNALANLELMTVAENNKHWRRVPLEKIAIGAV